MRRISGRGMARRSEASTGLARHGQFCGKPIRGRVVKKLRALVFVVYSVAIVTNGVAAVLQTMMGRYPHALLHVLAVFGFTIAGIALLRIAR